MSEANVVLLYGSDEYAIATRVNAFIKAMGDPTTADMNTTRFDPRNVEDEALNNALNAMPFLASKRLVILENPSKKWTGLDGHKKFLALLETIPPSAQLVIIETGEIKEKEKSAHWLLKWFAKHEKAKAQEFNLPRPREMPEWIINETKKQGGVIERQAAARLAEMTGEETRRASQEITKLLTYANFNRTIEIEDVEHVSIVSPQADVFSMVDALGEGNGKKAQKALHVLLEEDEAFSIFGMIVRQFRLLLLAREAMDAGEGQVLAQSLGVHPFVAEKLSKQARGFDINLLENIYRRLLKIDEDVKTGLMPIDTALEMFAADLTKKN